MPVNGKYVKTEVEFLDRNGNNVEKRIWTTEGNKNEDIEYSYDEAIQLAGEGCYIYGLVAVISLAFVGMALDMFGISVVVSGACDLNLSHSQKSTLLSIPFIGSIIMAWPWGYIADTQGRQKAMKFSLWGSFILATLSAFSPNWIVLAVLKLGSCSLASGTHSLGFTLLGESCSERSKGPFMVIATNALITTFGIYTVIGYFILNLQFSFDLGFITFSNWRLLILVFAMPLGISAFLLIFFYESPKFLLNAGKESKAVEFLQNIMIRNGGDITKYAINKVSLNETTSLRHKDVPLWKCLRDQTLPLFKPPLVYRTLQLFYMTAVIYSSNNGFFTWLPLVADTFYSGYEVNGTTGNTCDMIVNSDELDKDAEACVGTVKDLTLWMALIQTVVYISLNVAIAWLSQRKKAVALFMQLFTVVCGVLIPNVTDRLFSMILFNGFMVNCFCISIIFSYYVELFPTSYRGMAACLGVMVARSSSLFGTNLVGQYIASHCVTSFYAWSVYMLSGVIMTVFLPPDNPKSKS